MGQALNSLCDLDYAERKLCRAKAYNINLASNDRNGVQTSPGPPSTARRRLPVYRPQPPSGSSGGIHVALSLLGRPTPSPTAKTRGGSRRDSPGHSSAAAPRRSGGTSCRLNPPRTPRPLTRRTRGPRGRRDRLILSIAGLPISSL